MRDSITKTRRQHPGFYPSIGCLLFLAVLISGTLDLRTESVQQERADQVAINQTQ